ncbi:MAG: phosphotransferase [Bacteroidetes bacterium]|nr:phosphotransferase [Bacteroidota bacterium]
MIDSIEFPASLDQQKVEGLLKQRFPDKRVRIYKIIPMALDNSSSILVTLTAASGEDRIGHFRYIIGYELEGEFLSADLVIKVKPHGAAIAAMLEGLAAANGPELGNAYKTASAYTGFSYSHEKELFIDECQKANDIFPEIWGISRDEDAGLFYIMMEYLGEADLINSVMIPEKWTDGPVRQALKSAASWHARSMDLLKQDNFPHWKDERYYGSREELIPLYRALWQNAESKLTDLLDPEEYQLILKELEKAGTLKDIYSGYPKAIIHNDMNPRNCCFPQRENRKDFVLYDWELFNIHMPAYDAVEFLAFVLDEDRYAQREHYLNYYLDCLQDETGVHVLLEDRKDLFRALHLDFCYLRIGMYLMAHCLSPYPFLPRVVRSAMDGIRCFS